MPRSDKPGEIARQAEGEGKKAFLLRLPPRLFDELRAWAAADLRSVNGHIEFLLREAVKRRRGLGTPEQRCDDVGG